MIGQVSLQLASFFAASWKEIIGIAFPTVGVAISVGAIWNSRSLFKKQQTAQQGIFNQQLEKAQKAFTQDRAREFVGQCKAYAEEWMTFSSLHNLLVPTTNFQDWITILLNEATVLKESVVIYLGSTPRLLQLIDSFATLMQTTFEDIAKTRFKRVFNPNHVETYAIMPGDMIADWQGNVGFASRFFVFQVTGEIQKLILQNLRV
jgi:hypothetical protein